VIAFELRPEGTAAHADGAHQLVWPTAGGQNETVRASMDPWLGVLGAPSDAATDLVRIASGAYMADRLSPRRTGFSRTIRLHVQVVDAARWEASCNLVADLLHWLTSDTWLLELSNDGLERPETEPAAEPAETVALLSGGLDSFCGALLARDASPRLLVGHWDNSTIKGAQNRTWGWLCEDGGIGYPYRQIRVTQAEEKREASSRSRALLFTALAIAAADGARAAVAEVPENGFTSLNPPLGANRGGALSTRSTHPWTLYLVRQLLDAVDLTVELRDPHLPRTKGELLAAAVAAGPPSIRDGAAKTLSCGKLDGRLYPGGNQNHHCGLCVPCLVRRGGFIAAGLPDDTPYLVNYLVGDSYEKLLSWRGDDVAAVRLALERGFDDVDLAAQGPFPDDFDLDAALDLCHRGFEELRAVALP